MKKLAINIEALVLKSIKHINLNTQASDTKEQLEKIHKMLASDDPLEVEMAKITLKILQNEKKIGRRKKKKKEK